MTMMVFQWQKFDNYNPSYLVISWPSPVFYKPFHSGLYA